MSSRYHLSDRELEDLEFEHRHTACKRYDDCIKTVYLLGKGWPVTKIAEALLIDRETVRNHFKRYRKGGNGKFVLPSFHHKQPIAQEFFVILIQNTSETMPSK